MSDLISRQAAIEMAEQIIDGNASGKAWAILCELKKIPPADRKRGKWIQNDNEKRLGKICCSACNRSIYLSEYYRFCPNCGADMRYDK